MSESNQAPVVASDPSSIVTDIKRQKRRAARIRRRTVAGLLHNFLETCMSRYSDCGGYWLWGQVVENLTKNRIDLLRPTMESRAAALVSTRFNEQLDKHSIPPAWISHAELTLTKSPRAREGSVNGRRRTGWDLVFLASVTTDLGRIYRVERSIFVAPHDAGMELQRHPEFRR